MSGERFTRVRHLDGVSRVVGGQLCQGSLVVDPVHHRLQAWAAWLTGGAAGLGYPTKSVLHHSWMPPAPGQAPTMRTAAGDGGAALARSLHRDILSLSLRLQNTLVVVYLMRAKPAEQVRLLECQASTVRARLTEARRLLAGMADARARER